MVDRNFFSHHESSAVPVLLFWSPPWPAHDLTQRLSFLYCGFQHILSCCFPCSFVKYTFNILLRQDAVILFNCRFVTITWCNFTATCYPVFSLTAGIHALLVYTNLQAKFLKIWGLKSLNAAAASHIVTSRQSVIFFTSQSHFFTWLTPGTIPECHPGWDFVHRIPRGTQYFSSVLSDVGMEVNTFQ